jgi:Pregnancy-associated plasma protein-A
MSENTVSRRRKCGTMAADTRQLELDDNLRSARLRLESETRARRATDTISRRGVLTIPVIVHVVFNTDEQNISDAQIQSQIDVLNLDFRAQNPDLANAPDIWRPLATDAELQFRLEDVRRVHTDRTSYVDDAVKFTNSGGSPVIDPDRNLNIWVCNLDEVLGYAYLPGVNASIDGVVINFECFGTEGTAATPFDLGRTATHEVGHYLNLLHVWGGDTPSCTDSDLVDDTPNQSKPNFNKPAFPQISCNNGPNGDMFMNFMDYVDDDSMFLFTAQQVVRMRTALGEARPDLGQ